MRSLVLVASAASFLAASGAVSAQNSSSLATDTLSFDRMAACAEVYTGAAAYHDQAQRQDQASASRSKASTFEILMGSRMLRQHQPGSISEWSEVSTKIAASLDEYRTKVRGQLGFDQELSDERANEVFKQWLPYCDSVLPDAESQMLAEVSWQARLANALVTQ